MRPGPRGSEVLGGLAAVALWAVALVLVASIARATADRRPADLPLRPVYRVDTLLDAGPGSLRHAVSHGHRTVVFDVAGEIQLKSDLRITEPFLTIDGFSARPPGITLKNFGLLVSGGKGARDITIRGIRVRQSDQRQCDRRALCRGTGTGVGILVTFGASRVVIDHVSVGHSGNAAISVVKGARDVTISNSILLENKNLIMPNYNLLMLLSGVPSRGATERTRRVTLYRNLLVKGSDRMPQVKWSETGEQAPEIMADVRNNLIWGWTASATRIWKGAKANVVNNYYDAATGHEERQKRAIVVCHDASPQCDLARHPARRARAYVAGNVSGAGRAVTDYLNRLGSEAAPFDAPPRETTEACTAARIVLGSAGVRPLDDLDRHYLSDIELRSCQR